MLTDRELIDTANREVDIVRAAEIGGMRIVSGMKTNCPFCGERAFRVYPATNSARCFAESVGVTPVRMLVYAEGNTAMAVTRAAEAEAARKLLDAVGWAEPTLEHRYATAAAWSRPIETDSLAQALRVFCSRFPDWEDRQLDHEVAQRFNAYLGLLLRVRNDADAAKWLAAAKAGMRSLLSEEVQDASLTAAEAASSVVTTQ